MKRRIGIIGGGISGLTAAYVLTRDHAHTCEVTLYEASHRLGGIVETARQDGFTIECGPDSWVTEKCWAEDLARELGLANELQPSSDAERRTYIAQNGKLAALPDAMRMMVPTDLDALEHSPLFSATAIRAYRDEPGRAAELRGQALASRGPEADESVSAFVTRHFGAEVTAKVAGPLLAGVFGGDIEQLSARALLAPFVAMEQQHGSLILALQQRAARASVPVFTTLATGLGTLIERLAAALPPHCAHLDTPVTALSRETEGWVLETKHARTYFDAVLLATPLDATRQLLASLPIEAAKQAAASLPHDASSSLIAALAYKPDTAAALTIPRGFGLLVARGNDDPPHSLLACTFLHQKFAHRAPSGGVVLRAFFGSAAADVLSSRGDNEIAAAAHQQLARLLGPLPAADLTLVRRWPRSLPQYAVGHLSRIHAFEQAIAAIPALSVAGNALHGVGLPDLIRDATRAANLLAAE